MRVPDIGDFKDVPVIEVIVKPGDTVKAEDALVTLESDKATMDVPAPLGGTVQEIKLKVGDKVSEGAVVAHARDLGRCGCAAPLRRRSPRHRRRRRRSGCPARVDACGGRGPDERRGRSGVRACLCESGRAQARARARRRSRRREGKREQGARAQGRRRSCGQRRACRSERRCCSTSRGRCGGIELLPWPKVDFAKFGAVESKPLSRIKKISGANLHRNWVMIPHVTNHDDADITDLEAFRVQLNKENEKSGVRVWMLAFMIKAACATLAKFPEFNASLDGDNLILKKYYHIGFAADTPQGLVVPVIRDADKKGVVDIAKEMGELAKLARDGKLKPDQMQGGSFTISSLGGIGGVYFTPIINAPEVAIMGVCRSFWKQVSADGKTSSWRYVLPLSLSWDHRVIDGASAARFNTHFGGLLADFRRVLL